MRSGHHMLVMTVVVEATVLIPTVIPAKAGIQYLCFAHNNRMTA
jgi:hypothetical protein